MCSFIFYSDSLSKDRRVVRRVTTSCTTSDNEWQRVVKRMTTSDKERQRMTTYDNEWYNEW